MSTPSTSRLPGTNVATPQPTSQFSFSSPAPKNTASPAPKNTASPAAQRSQQAGKSPFNASAQNHPTGGSNVSGGGQNRFLEPLSGSTPNFESPAGMVPSLSSMGFGDGAFNMSYSNSTGMAIGSSLGGRIDESKRRRRLESIVSTLRSRYPRLSPEGMVLVGQRLGMDTFSVPQREGNKKGPIDVQLLVGEVLMVDVLFMEDNVVPKVKVTVFGASDRVNQDMESASDVLLRDVTQPRRLPILRNLDKFSHNVERLSQLAKLQEATQSPEFSCFEALSGIYTSLKRLFDQEKKLIEVLIDSKKSNRQARIEREVMSKRSGRPVMNARDTVGLSLDYWMQRRRFFPAQKDVPEDSMDIDSSPLTDPSTEVPDQKVFSLLLECEGCPHELFPPARISHQWISDSPEKVPDINTGTLHGIDWEEPPPTLITPISQGPDAMVLDMESRLPNIRFVAKLNPPLIMPSQIVANILATVGLQPEPSQIQPLYHNALLGIEVDQLEFMGREKTLSYLRKTFARKAGNESADIYHRNYLTSKSPMFSRTMEQIPFSHPRQIVEILPILRQWAFINSLLIQSFSSTVAEDQMENLPISKMDVTFAASTTQFNVRFPLGDSSSQTSITDTSNKSLTEILRANRAKQQNAKDFELCFFIGLNGDISINDSDLQTINPFEAAPSTSTQAEAKERLPRYARNLDIAGDLDLWVEWLKHSMLNEKP